MISVYYIKLDSFKFIKKYIIITLIIFLIEFIIIIILVYSTNIYNFWFK